MKLEIPATLKDYSIDQANRVIEFFRNDIESKSDERMIVGLVSAVTGLSEDTLMRVDMSDLNHAYKLITKHFDRKKNMPPKEVVINGKSYEFQQDLNSKGWNAGRYIDIKSYSSVLETSPEYIVALCYIEKGSVYRDFPLEERAKIMKENFPGEYYIDLIAFFLLKYKRLNPGFSLLQLAKAQIAQEKAMKILQNHGSDGSTSYQGKTIQSGIKSPDGNGRNFFSRLLIKLRMTRRR